MTRREEILKELEPLQKKVWRLRRELDAIEREQSDRFRDEFLKAQEEASKQMWKERPYYYV